MKYSNENSKKNSFFFLRKTLNLLNNLQNDVLIEQDVIELKSQFRTPIGEFAADILTDIECLTGTYKSESFDYLDLFPELSYKEKIELIKKKITESEDIPSHQRQKIFKIYTRWIKFEGDKIEVDCVLDNGWDGIVYQGKENENYYFKDLMWCGGAYVERCKIIDEQELNELKNKI